MSQDPTMKTEEAMQAEGDGLNMLNPINLIREAKRMLRDYPHPAGKSREISIAITKAEECEMWVERAGY